MPLRSPCTSRRPTATYLFALLVVFGCCSTLFAAEPAATPQFTVSCFDLGTVDQIRGVAQELADELNSQEWCTAKPLASAKVWNEVPTGVDPKQWLSVVTVGYGLQAEAYALMFDGPHGTARLIAHTPNPKGTLRGIPTWYSPFVTLLNGVRIGYNATPPATSIPLGIELREVTASAENKITAKPGFGEALTIGPERIVPPLKAVIVAAACSAGWSPTLASVSPAVIPSRAVVEFEVLDQACRFRVTFAHGGTESVVVKERIPWDEFHEQLAAVFRTPLGDRRIHDFLRLDRGDVSLLASTESCVAYLADDELAALDAATGREAWRIRLPKNPAARVKPVEKYVVRTAAGGMSGAEPRLLRWTKSLAEIAWLDGKETPLAPVPVAASWAFDVDGKSGAVTATAAKVTRYFAGKEVWSAVDTAPITTRPTIVDTRVVAGNERGELFALALADGKPLWRVTLEGGIAGTIEPCGGYRLVFSPRSETLVAIDPQDGSTKWRFAAGDRLLQPPLEHAGRVLVVTKQNRIFALDPQSGSLLAETTRPTWIVGLTIVSHEGRPRPALLDLGGKVALLGDDLKPIWEAQLPSRPTGRAALMTLPVVWSKTEKAAATDDLLATINSDAVPRRPLLLVTDQHGFLYRLSLPGTR